MEITNYGEQSLQSEVLYQVEDAGKVVYSGKFPSTMIQKGEVTSIGQLQYTINSGLFGKKLDIQVSIKDTPYKNRWSIWVFPSNSSETLENNVLVTRSLQDAMALV